MTYLNSVGSFIDLDSGMVYPANSDNTPDLDCGTEIDNLSPEWCNSITGEDLQLLTEDLRTYVFNNYYN